MQRLALVTGEFPPQQGGVGDYTRELAREFARLGVTVKVITSAYAPSPLQGESWGEGRSPVESFTVHHTSFASWHSLAQIDRLTRDCELVHIQYQAAAYGMTPPIHVLPRYLRWRDARRKVVVTFHDLKVPYLFPKAGRLRWRAITLLAQSCNAVIVTNQEDFEILNSQLPTSNLQPPTSNFQPPTSNFQLPISSLQSPLPNHLSSSSPSAATLTPTPPPRIATARAPRWACSPTKRCSATSVSSTRAKAAKRSSGFWRMSCARGIMLAC